MAGMHFIDVGEIGLRNAMTEFGCAKVDTTKPFGQQGHDFASGALEVYLAVSREEGWNHRPTSVDEQREQGQVQAALHRRYAATYLTVLTGVEVEPTDRSLIGSFDFPDSLRPEVVSQFPDLDPIEHYYISMYGAL